ncbi:phosphosulfolactate synthase [archaeon 13_1_20CM_2_54_9]|nr:MAG: phosphosulfolactate synthase [Crenarchaeota archaeon 13_1_40CM_3_53_5]OLE74275.1 MAG: phosphosulfolactate synthase [archaeon 13_1_20CM_2_54_9]
MTGSTGEKTFDFVQIGKLAPKPRDTGVIEIRGPYYTTVTYGYLKDILDDWGEYVDGFKFAGGSMRLLTRVKTREIIKLCHDQDVYVSTGGFVERVIAQGPEAVDKYLEECKALEFDMIEVSSGLAPIKLEDKVAIVKQVQKLGMKAKPEVSMMIGAGAGTHIVGYRPKMRSFTDVAKETAAHLNVGAKILMLESEGITEDLPPRRWRKNAVKKLVEKFGYKTWMFEASDPPVFKWYLKTFGKDVNLFIDHSQIVEFNAWRLGLWGDSEIWKGKRLSYPGTK